MDAVYHVQKMTDTLSCAESEGHFLSCAENERHSLSCAESVGWAEVKDAVYHVQKMVIM